MAFKSVSVDKIVGFCNKHVPYSDEDKEILVALKLQCDVACGSCTELLSNHSLYALIEATYTIIQRRKIPNFIQWSKVSICELGNVRIYKMLQPIMERSYKLCSFHAIFSLIYLHSKNYIIKDTGIHGQKLTDQCKKLFIGLKHKGLNECESHFFAMSTLLTDPPDKFEFTITKLEKLNYILEKISKCLLGYGFV